MHLRRALILIAVILGLTALAASLAPSPRTPVATAPPTSTTPPTIPVPALPPTVPFSAPPLKRPPVRDEPSGAHVVVQVSAAATGQASLPTLGLSAPVTPGTPASFDVLVPSGSAAVTFTPTGGATGTVGTLRGR